MIELNNKCVNVDLKWVTTPGFITSDIIVLYYRRCPKIRYLVAVLFLILSCISAGAAPKPEFRGAWVTAWSEGFLTPEEADETVRMAKEANLNALFIQVRKVGDAYYKSNYETRAGNIKGPADYDPLAYIIEKAHANGIEVHAWINTFRVWTGSSQPTDPNHIAIKHPDWLTRTASGDKKGADGLFLDPGVQEVQDYTYNIFSDVARNYNVDGIHMDYVRYPSQEFGYAPGAVAKFNEETGRTGIPDNNDPAWQDWRRDQVTKLVKRISKGVTSIRPGVKVSVAAISWGDCSGNFCDASPFVRVYQDWRRWLADGIVDACIPMNYKDDKSARNALWYRNWLDGFNRWQYDRHIYGGLDFNRDPESVVRQLEACRKRDIKGMVGFSFNQTEARTKLVRMLKSSIYSEPAEIPVMPWKVQPTAVQPLELPCTPESPVSDIQNSTIGAGSAGDK